MRFLITACRQYRDCDKRTWLFNTVTELTPEAWLQQEIEGLEKDRSLDARLGGYDIILLNWSQIDRKSYEALDELL